MLILQLIESGEQLIIGRNCRLSSLLEMATHNSIYRIGKWIEISFVTC